MEKIERICGVSVWLSTENPNNRHRFLLLRRQARSTIHSRDGRPQGSRSRKRRKPSGDRRLSRRTGPSGPDRRRNGQAASAVEVGSRGTFGRAGNREADLRERGTDGQPARASPRSGPSGRDHVGSPSGRTRREGVRGLFGAMQGRPRRSTWRLLCVWAVERQWRTLGAKIYPNKNCVFTPCKCVSHLVELQDWFSPNCSNLRPSVSFGQLVFSRLLSVWRYSREESCNLS